jgi:ornithine cyclodeaminase/alanine dehydrogenase-like protein (mu-crystallin family)
VEPTILVLRDEDVSGLLSTTDYLEAMEIAFAELGHGRAVSRTRTDCSVLQRSGDVFRFKTMDGIVPSVGLCALRVVSDAIFFYADDVARYDKTASTKHNQVAFILLFDIESTLPVALLPDRHLQRMRVGCTSAIAARRLARKDASSLGILGSGWQAMAQALAMIQIRPIRQISVFSPTKAHRERFAVEVERVTAVPAQAVASPEEAAQADIVSVATNSREPVLFWDWLRPGTHLTTIRFPDVAVDVYRKADIVLTNQRPPTYWRPSRDNYAYLHDFAADGVPTVYGEERRLDPTDPDFLDFHQFASLPELVVGRIDGRTEDKQITFHVNNIGLGVQFATVGAELFRRARLKNRGIYLPASYFLSTGAGGPGA